MRLVLCFACACIAILATCVPMFCEKCVEDEKVALEAVSQISHESMLDAVVMPDIRNRIVALAGLHLGSQSDVLAIRFYKIVESENLIDGTKIVGEGTDLSYPPPEWIVAVTPKCTVYILEHSPFAGGDPYKESMDSFNKFIRENIPVLVEDKEKALEVFFLFMHTAHAQDFLSLVRDDMELESVALEDFRDRLGVVKGRKAFESWWRQVSANTKKTISVPAATQVEDGFEITYFYYFPGKIARQKFTVHRDGTISELR